MLRFSSLPAPLDLHCLPQHVAVIMDGNGRWATERGLPRAAGHRQGAKALKELVRCCKDWGIPALTVYAFSTENWRRPTEEVDFLLLLFERLLRQELAEMQQSGVKLSFVGDLSALPPALRQEMQRSHNATLHNQQVHLTVAINYGSRAEITQICRQLAEQAQQGRLNPAEITEELLSECLNTTSLPHPDLLIRTSGEMRLSNFLLWQLAYAELYFTRILWPDFDRAAFYEALVSYQRRDRRFGQVSASQPRVAGQPIPALVSADR
ncbi:MAG: isoprenyl transferase [Aphanocapsa sp. GSE-SYN-MK-11-07L]|nr:isoprenyl transferase [Aphanocapsa sp. GSE-SYN-MK-11-07L]